MGSKVKSADEQLGNYPIGLVISVTLSDLQPIVSQGFMQKIEVHDSRVRLYEEWH